MSREKLKVDKDLMVIEVARKTKCDLKVLAYLSQDLDDRAVAILCGNVSTMFKKNQLGSILYRS